MKNGEMCQCFAFVILWGMQKFW